MTVFEYQLKFHTPAFLGNAEQNGQWRTPPIKALLRQWWRVAYAADHGFVVDQAAMRREEGLLFGHAWLANDTFQRDGRLVTKLARKREVTPCVVNALRLMHRYGTLAVDHATAAARANSSLPNRRRSRPWAARRYATGGIKTRQKYAAR